MPTPQTRARQGQLRRLPTGPSAFLMGTADEIKVLEPMVVAAGMAVVVQPIDPLALDVDELLGNEALATRVGNATLALVVADVCGDDRLPLISLVDDALAPDRVLLVSCTQAGAQEQAAICQHPGRVVGVGLLGLLSGQSVAELAPSRSTAPDALAQGRRFLEALGATVFEVQDAPGLVLARVLMPVVNEAAFALTEGVASAEDIDTAMQLGANFPFGPLHWADAIGIDRVLLAMEYLIQSTYDPRFRPAPLLRRMAQAGHTGVAAGQGFFAYSEH
jgi:3-hydroxybutyryl-CoA dehydrogenase